MSLVVGVAYLVVLGCLACFGAHRLHLLIVLGSSPREPAPEGEPVRWPTVVVQLPIYNEAPVTARLIDAVARIDYPRESLEVQVLDDSTDETVEIAAQRVAHHQGAGLAIEHVRRADRRGFKAGALANGLTLSEAEFIAIFDADFVPPEDFLRRTVPHMIQDTGLGLVQARWGHINRETNLLTRLQALALDAHFSIEQAARSRSGRFFNFNGTAGVWRRAAIESAGGWSSETITEDLDLSFRSQLCGWRFRFLDDLVVPAELPEDLAAFRTQQQRWTRGSAQTLRKLFRPVWTTPGVSWEARLEATFQLLLNAAYPLMFLLALLSTPLAALGYPQHLALIVAQWVFFGFASWAVALFYLAAQRQRGWLEVARAAGYVPLLFACGLGLSLSNGYAWLAGLLAGPVPFERTPKRGALGKRRYRARKMPLIAWAELAMAGVLLAGVVLAVRAARFEALPFLGLVALGFLALGGGGLLSSWAASTATPTDPKARTPPHDPIPRSPASPGTRGG